MSEESDFLAELQDGFLLEAADLMNVLEESFLKVEQDPHNKEEMEKVFRVYHNLKGSAAAVGFDALSKFAHHIENLLVPIRKGEMLMTETNADLLLKCNDRVKHFIELLKTDKTAVPQTQDIVDLLAIACKAPAVAAPPPPPVTEHLAEIILMGDLKDSNIRTQTTEILNLLSQWAKNAKLKETETLIQQCMTLLQNLEQECTSELITKLTSALNALCNLIQTSHLANNNQVKPAPKTAASVETDPKLLADFLSDAKDQCDSIDSAFLVLEKDAANKEAVHAMFRGFHTMKSASAIVGLAAIETLSHDVESLLEPMRETGTALSEKLTAVLLESVNLLKSLVQGIAQTGTPGDAGKVSSVQMLHEKLLQLRLKELSTIQPGEALSAPAVPDTSASASVASLAPAATGTTDPAAAQGNVMRDPIKVDAERLDRLIDTIGEMVIAETMVHQSQELSHLNSASALYNHLSQLNKITRRLQEIGMSLRMVPIRPTFKKMIRIVRDLSKKLDKDIDFQLIGEDTELDKTIADKIGDPLVHMVRNAIDHGIENNRQDRMSKGKSSTGRVQLRASMKSGSVIIEIEDDGRGMNKEVLLKKGIERGLIRPGDAPSDKEIYNLIFHPGFSLAEKVTDVSGRGVGMDVVRKNIESLRGQVDIKSELGKGSLFTIRIPHTLAIIEGMVIMVGREYYVIPTYSILSTVKPDPKDIHTVSGGKGQMFKFQGELLPLFRLADFYGVQNAENKLENQLVLIIEEDTKKIALMINKILRQQQFVIKALGDFTKDVPGISGGTIMPDGNVGLILDVGSLMKEMTH